MTDRVKISYTIKSEEYSIELDIDDTQEFVDDYYMMWKFSLATIFNQKRGVTETQGEEFKKNSREAFNLLRKGQNESTD